jgi:LacI family transcriptional regulator
MYRSTRGDPRSDAGRATHGNVRKTVDGEARMTEAVTLADVAREAGVSLATASRVLTKGSRNPRPELRDKVMLAARRLNYSPNAAAQAIARGTTNILGLVVHDLADPYFSTIAVGVARAAEARGLLVTVTDTGRDPQRELESLAVLRQQRPRALIVAGTRSRDRSLRAEFSHAAAAVMASGVRVAVIGQAVPELDSVVIDNRQGARALATKLVALDYRKFAILAGPGDLQTAYDRFTGFREGLRRSGINTSDLPVVPGEFTREGGYDALMAVLATDARPEVVFAVNDVMAVGALAALRDNPPAGRAPAVAGFDDIRTLRDITPQLTTVRVPLEELGQMAADLVLRDASLGPQHIRVACEVVVRESTPRLSPGGARRKSPARRY